MATDDRQRIRDEEHLKLLSIFHYVSGGITAFSGLFPLIYVIMGALFLTLPVSHSADDDLVLRGMGSIFMVFGIVFSLFFMVFAAMKIYAGYCLSRSRNRVYCLVVAGISLIGFPFSTLLGIFTLIVLLRDSVRELFDRPAVERGAAGIDLGSDG
jgi:hypothetical protein